MSVPLLNMYTSHATPIKPVIWKIGPVCVSARLSYYYGSFSLKVFIIVL